MLKITLLSITLLFFINCFANGQDTVSKMTDEEIKFSNYYSKKRIIIEYFATSSICRKIELLDSMINAQFIKLKLNKDYKFKSTHFYAIDSNGYIHFIEPYNLLPGIVNYSFYSWIVDLPDDLQRIYELNNYYKFIEEVRDSNGVYLYDIYVKSNACWFCVEAMLLNLEYSCKDDIIDPFSLRTDVYPFFFLEPPSEKNIEYFKKKYKCK